MYMYNSSTCMLFFHPIPFNGFPPVRIERPVFGTIYVLLKFNACSLRHLFQVSSRVTDNRRQVVMSLPISTTMTRRSGLLQSRCLQTRQLPAAPAATVLLSLCLGRVLLHQDQTVVTLQQRWQARIHLLN